MRQVGLNVLPGALYGSQHFFSLGAWLTKPVAAPDAVQLPAMAFQHRLAQAVAVAGRSGVVIAGAIAFDAQQIAAWLVGVHHGQVNEETGNADLRLHLQAQLRELLG